jgi:transcriptional regulator GlxA family with amidase domain
MEQRILAVVAFMERHLHRDLTLEEMAQHVNLSPSRLRHLFKVETSTSPVQYLKLLRMRKARELAETTFLSIKEIRNRVGIRDKHHFAEEFKKAYGVTPTRYREERRLITDLSAENFTAHGVAKSATK